MNKLIDVLGEKLVPVAVKINQIKFLQALRDAFAALMPIIITGSLFGIINWVVLDPNGTIMGTPGLNIGHLITGLTGTAYANSGFVAGIAKLQYYCDIIITGTLNVFSLFLVVMLSRRLAENEEVDSRGATIVSLANFLILSPQFVKWTLASGKAITVTKAFSTDTFGSTNVLFTMLITIASVKLFAFLTHKKGLIIKLPDGVPPAVAQSFASLLPTVMTIALLGAIGGFLHAFGQAPLSDWIYQLMQKPMMGFSQGLGFACLYQFLSVLFWWFGIHGQNIMAAVTNTVYVPAQLANQTAGAHYIFTDGFFNLLLPSTLGVVIAVFLFARRDDYRAVGKIGLWPALFNIGEPVVFGLPTMLNPLFLIPCVVAPVINIVICWAAIASGLVPIVKYAVPWTMPVFFNGMLATGSWTGGVLQIVTVIVNVFAYAPFFAAANKMAARKNDIDA